MTVRERFGQEVATWLIDESPSRPNEPLADRIITQAGRTRQRPHWLAVLKEPPMRISSNLAVGSPTVRVAAVMAATLLLATLVIGAGVAGARSLASRAIVVDPSGGGTTTTISEAVAMAADGDTILVRPGTYDESVTITRDITIRGDGDRADVVIEITAPMRAEATVNDPDLPDAFRLVGSDATIENLTFRGDSSRIVILGGAPTLVNLHLDGIGRVFGVDPGMTSVAPGVEITDGSNALITASLLSDVGMNITRASSPTLSHNDWSGGGVLMDGAGVEALLQTNRIEGTSSVSAVTVWGGARPTIRDNVIRHEAATAIHVRDAGFLSTDRGTRAEIIGNRIEGSREGISVLAGASAHIEDNRFLGNERSISVASSSVTVKDNLIRDRLSGIVVAVFRGGVSPMIVGNDIAGIGGRAVAVGLGTSPVLAANRICDNDVNLWVHEEASPVVEDSNEICADAAPDVRA